MGKAFVGDSLELLADLPDNSVNLVVTSPPFALQRSPASGHFDLGAGLAELGRKGEGDRKSVV